MFVLLYYIVAFDEVSTRGIKVSDRQTTDENLEKKKTTNIPNNNDPYESLTFAFQTAAAAAAAAAVADYQYNNNGRLKNNKEHKKI